MTIREVQKLQGGGGIPAFTSFITVPLPMPAAPYSGVVGGDTDTSASSSKSDSSNGLGILSKEIIKAIYESGLRSDTLAFIKNLDNFVVDSNNPFDRGNVISKYKLLLGLLTALRTGKEQLDNAVKQSQQNGSFLEMAITADGRYYILDEDGQIHRTSVLKPGVRVLTNAELADLRANRLPYEDNIAAVILNGVSMETIDKKIWEAVSKMGTTEESRQFFRTKKGQQIKEGIDALLSDSKDGTYKITQQEKGLTQQATEALKYIIGTLKPNEIALLRGKASLMGLDPAKGAIELVKSLMTSGLDETKKFDVSYDASINKEDSESSKSEKQKLEEAKLKEEKTQATQIQSGLGGSPFYLTLNPGQHLAMQVSAKLYGLLLNKSDDSVKNGSLENVLQDSRISMYANTSNGIYVGNQRIDPENYGQVYINTSQASRAYLPAVQEADGSVHPDFTLLDEYARVEKQIRELGPKVSKLAIESIIRKSPLSMYVIGIDDSGNIQWDEDKFRPFLMLNAMAAGHNGFFNLRDNPTEGVINYKTLDNWGTNIKYMQGIDEDILRNKMSSVLGYKVEGDIFSALAYIPIGDSTTRSLGNKSKLGDIALEEANRKLATYQDSKTNKVIQ